MFFFDYVSNAFTDSATEEYIFLFIIKLIDRSHGTTHLSSSRSSLPISATLYTFVAHACLIKDKIRVLKIGIFPLSFCP
jgi:hypothetical protein